jgi:fatty-acyl-CoA synthase
MSIIGEPTTEPRMTSRSPAWPAGEPWLLDLPDGTLYDALERTAESRPDQISTAFYGTTTSYAELRRRVDAVAGFLQTVCGVAAGDRVLIALQNSPHYVAAYYAVMRANAVIVPLNPMSRTAEIDHLATDSGARVAIIGGDFIEMFAPLAGAALDHIRGAPCASISH